MRAVEKSGVSFARRSPGALRAAGVMCRVSSGEGGGRGKRESGRMSAKASGCGGMCGAGFRCTAPLGSMLPLVTSPARASTHPRSSAPSSGQGPRAAYLLPPGITSRHHSPPPTSSLPLICPHTTRCPNKNTSCLLKACSALPRKAEQPQLCNARAPTGPVPFLPPDTRPVRLAWGYSLKQEYY